MALPTISADGQSAAWGFALSTCHVSIHRAQHGLPHRLYEQLGGITHYRRVHWATEVSGLSLHMFACPANIAGTGGGRCF